MKTIPMLALAAATLAACGGADDEMPAGAGRATAATYTVTADLVATTVPVDGTVHARHRVDISTRMMARVTEVPVELGSPVRAGQTLIRLGGRGHRREPGQGRGDRHGWPARPGTRRQRHAGPHGHPPGPGRGGPGPEGPGAPDD
jgi:hypothetical protein